jgi:acyl carrier protein
MSLQIDTSKLGDETSLLTDLHLDSIQILELVVGIEETFGFSMESEELSIDLFDSLGELIDYICSHMSAATNRTAG